jgi:hypothetical protein
MPAVNARAAACVPSTDQARCGDDGLSYLFLSFVLENRVMVYENG